MKLPEPGLVIRPLITFRRSLRAFCTRPLIGPELLAQPTPCALRPRVISPDQFQAWLAGGLLQHLLLPDP